MIEYLIIILATSLFGLQHSGLSTRCVKARIINGWGKEGYARIFNTTSILTLLIAFLSMNFWDWIYFVLQPALIQPLLFILGILSGLGGAVLSMTASRVISVSTVADMRTDRKTELVTDGIYSRVRHPLYLATLLMFSAFSLIYPFPVVFVFSLSMIIYTMIGAYFEERKLLKYYGDEYLEYKKTAGFILPKLR
ncbi:MAG: isoprenylcysteine carboxylmethyltransferase family protein [Candidatus Thorarchaeota archaeon]|nr:MAG: isoprenylcysteine carboxylmethyltransferase family protein [Candidatus Thorarchaeota archaeon]